MIPKPRGTKLTHNNYPVTKLKLAVRSKTCESRQGGVAVFDDKIMGTPLDGFSNWEIDKVFVVFKLLGSTFKIVCICIEPEQNQINEVFKKHTCFQGEHKLQEFILMGDFNDRHNFLVATDTTRRVCRFKNFQSSSNLYVMNWKETTFTPLNRGSSVNNLYIPSNHLSLFTASTAMDCETSGVKCSRARTLSGTVTNGIRTTIGAKKTTKT